MTTYGDAYRLTGRMRREGAGKPMTRASIYGLASAYKHGARLGDQER